MTDVLLFHHAQGLTEGVRAFADALRAAGHEVALPDLYDGLVLPTLDEGIAQAERIGIGEILERGRAAAAGLPSALVYAGFSLGVLPAQLLAQTRPGALGALLFQSCVAPGDLGAPWPAALPAQIHLMEQDPVALAGGDLANARALAAGDARAQLFLYPGQQHLFADSSLDGYDRAATVLLTRRTLDFLAGAGRPQRDTPML